MMIKDKTFFKINLTIILTVFIIILSSNYVSAEYCSGNYWASCAWFGTWQEGCTTNGCSWGTYCCSSGDCGVLPDMNVKGLDAAKRAYLPDVEFGTNVNNPSFATNLFGYESFNAQGIPDMDCCNPSGQWLRSCSNFGEEDCNSHSPDCTWHTGCLVPGHCYTPPKTFCEGVGGGCAGTYTTKRHWYADVAMEWDSGVVYGLLGYTSEGVPMLTTSPWCNTCDDHNNYGYKVSYGRWIEMRCKKAAFCIGGVWWGDFVDVAPAYNYHSCVGLPNATCGTGIYSSCYKTATDGYCTCPVGATEICNGLDDNCAGGIDEGVSPTTQSCSNSIAGIGTCFGTQSRTCNGLSGWGDWSTCSADTPAVEACDGVDNDCNSATADGSAETWFNTACDGIDADLCSDGLYVCSSGAKTCNDDATSKVETCDGVDNDCNSATADGSAEAWFNTACDGTDSDLCADGVFVCSSGAKTCNDDATSKVETCDGTDNDCDGSIDEDFECAKDSTGCSSTCTWMDCNPTFKSNTVACDYNGSTYICVPGNSSTVSVSYSGGHCDRVNYVQVDFVSADGCRLQYTGSMTSRTVDSVGTIDPRSLKYTFSGSVPDNCAGSVISRYEMSTRTGNPSATPTIIRGYAAGQLSMPFTIAQCGGGNYVPYKDRINFSESPTFLVPTKTSAPVITSICSSYKSNNVSTVLPALYVDSINIGISSTTPCSAIPRDSYTLGNAHSYCHGLNNNYTGTIISESGTNLVGKCVRCYVANPPVAYPTTLVDPGVVHVPITNANYVCSNISDGVCPNDFTLGLCPIDSTTGYNIDADCGTHLKINCLDVYNTSGVKTGSTCTTLSGVPIQDPAKVNTSYWCAIQNTLTSATQLHTQCTTGAVVQDPTTGCPICLAPGANVTYLTGVVKYVPTQSDPVGRIEENLTLGAQFYNGAYYACPAKKYHIEDSDGLMCYPDNARCDQGYRTTAVNNLQRGCDKPAVYNSSTGKWTLNNNCLYKNVQNQYTTYCGLQSWYNNYEIYDDQFKIVVI